MKKENINFKRLMTFAIAATMCMTGLAVLPTATAFQTTLLSEDFNAGVVPPTDWSHYSLGETNLPWTSHDLQYHSPPYSAIHHYCYLQGTYDDWLVTPPIDVSGYTNIQLSWWNFHYTLYGYDYNGLYISCGSLDPNDGDYVEIMEMYPYDELTWVQNITLLDPYITGDTIYIAWRYQGEQPGMDQAWWIDDVEITGEEVAVPEPDLDCGGSLSWTDVTPGDTVSGSITVENIGDTDSLLDWQIDSYPDWGTWSFTPESGTDLLAGETSTITVEVVAPDEQEETFTGEVVLVNSENPDDTCIIDVSLATPVNQQVINPLLQMILERFPNAFPILRRLMGL